MLRDPIQRPGACKMTAAHAPPTTACTACRGSAADTSPDELSMLADQLTDFRRSARVLRVQSALEQVRSFVAGHVVTTALAVALLAAMISLLSR